MIAWKRILLVKNLIKSSSFEPKTDLTSLRQDNCTNFSLKEFLFIFDFKPFSYGQTGNNRIKALTNFSCIRNWRIRNPWLLMQKERLSNMKEIERAKFELILHVCSWLRNGVKSWAYKRSARSFFLSCRGSSRNLMNSEHYWKNYF